MTLRCGHCQQVIGVYEPAIAFIAGLAVRTSVAAQPDIRRADCYHEACYREAFSQYPPPDVPDVPDS
jgi:hypothetical protein